MASEVVLGLDVGTQSAKLVAAASDGDILAEERIAHGVSRPAPGHFEQDAEAVWWNDVKALLSRVAARDDLVPKALCVSGIGPTALPTTAENAPLRPGVLYGIDTRALTEIAALEARFDRDATIAVCGSAVSVQSPIPKLLWLKAHEPESFAKMRRWFTAHAWLITRLTGAYAVDHHSASQFVPVYDCANGRWRDEVWSELLPGVETPALAAPRRHRRCAHVGRRRRDRHAGGAPDRDGHGRRLVGGLQRLRRLPIDRHDHVRFDLYVHR